MRASFAIASNSSAPMLDVLYRTAHRANDHNEKRGERQDVAGQNIIFDRQKTDYRKNGQISDCDTNAEPAQKAPENKQTYCC